MSTTHELATPSLSTIISTGFNTLGDGSRVVSSAVNNDSDLYLYADLELSFASAAFGAGAYVDLYLLESVDGSNYEDGDSSTTPTSQCHLARVPFRNATAAQIHTVKGVILPPTKFKILAETHVGVTLAGSGNTLKISRYNEQDV